MGLPKYGRGDIDVDLFGDSILRAAKVVAPGLGIDVFAAPADGSGEPTNLTPDNDGTDTLPTVSPDGLTELDALFHEEFNLIDHSRDIVGGSSSSSAVTGDCSCVSLSTNSSTTSSGFTPLEPGEDPIAYAPVALDERGASAA